MMQNVNGGKGMSEPDQELLAALEQERTLNAELQAQLVRG